MLVTVRFIYAKLPDIVCVEYDGLYYFVRETQMHKAGISRGYYKINKDYLRDGESKLRYD